MNEYPFFLVAFACLIIHEMDAVRCHEWRVLPITSWMEDKLGFHAFMWLHLPLFVWFLWALGGSSERARAAMDALDLFMIVHVLLHIVFIRHPKYEFKTVMSWVWIIGAGLAGAIDLVLTRIG
ncbi:MAG: hypothetical protein KGS46_17575 [Chloroflexi bacterium]|nr:hypothetical protein [Chloroflexota bacterium]